MYGNHSFLRSRILEDSYRNQKTINNAQILKMLRTAGRINVPFENLFIQISEKILDTSAIPTLTLKGPASVGFGRVAKILLQ